MGKNNPEALASQEIVSTKSTTRAVREPIHDALLRIQQDLLAPKNIHNDQQNFNYRSAEGILEAVKPLLGALHLTVVFNDEVVKVDTNVIYIHSTAVLSNGKDTLSASGWAREDFRPSDQKAMQGTGACITYAHKMALGSLLAIDDAKTAPTIDPDCEAPTPPLPTKEEDAPAREPSLRPAPQLPRMDASHPRWNACILTAAKWNRGGADVMRSEIQKKYTISDEDFKQLVRLSGRVDLAG